MDDDDDDDFYAMIYQYVICVQVHATSLLSRRIIMAMNKEKRGEGQKI
jgi:hypothetical protein